MDQDVSVVSGIFSFFGWMLLLAFLVPWLAVMHAAYQKGISVGSAALVGFFGTPLLGLLYVIAHPADKDVLEQRAIRSGRRKRCPKCLSPYHPEAQVCAQCGAGFRVEVPPEASPLDGVDTATHRVAPSASTMPERKPPASVDENRHPGMEVTEEYVERAEPDTAAAEEFRRRLDQRNL